MVSKVDIVNMALSEIGCEPVSDYDEDSAQAIKAMLYYPNVRDSLLRGYPWSFALKQWNLARVSTKEKFGGFKYAFLKPVDCLRFLRTVDADCVCAAAGRYIWSDEDALDVIGIGAVDNENLFDPIFVELFVLKLAEKLAVVLANDKGIRDRLAGDFDRLIKTGQAKTAMEGPDQQYRYDSTWLAARG